MPPFVKKTFSWWQSRPQSWGAARPQQWWPARPQQWGAPRPQQGWFASWARPASTGPQRTVGGQRTPGMTAREARMTYINEMIKAPKVLLTDDSGEKQWIISRDEALRRASAEWLDLVQLAYNPVDMICTAKIVDYGKYMYDKSKDDKAKKMNQKSKWGKDIKMSYTIWENDLLLKIKKAEEFLEDGYTVRFIVRMKWRERIFIDKAIEKMKLTEQRLETHGKSQGVKQEPNGISLFLLPKAK